MDKQLQNNVESGIVDEVAVGKDFGNIKIIEKEINGPTGLEPTRYGDWEKRGRCIDF